MVRKGEQVSLSVTQRSLARERGKGKCSVSWEGLLSVAGDSSV